MQKTPPRNGKRPLRSDFLSQAWVAGAQSIMIYKFFQAPF